LRDLLEKQAHTIDLETEKGAGQKLLEEGKKHLVALKKAEKKREKDVEPLSLSSPMEQLLARRDDLKGLPLALGTACQTGDEQVRLLARMSSRVRRLQALRSIRYTPPSQPVPTYPSAPRPRPPAAQNINTHLLDYLRDCNRETEKKELLVRP